MVTVTSLSTDTFWKYPSPEVIAPNPVIVEPRAVKTKFSANVVSPSTANVPFTSVSFNTTGPCATG